MAMTSKHLRRSALAALVVLALPSLALGASFQNGSFETPGLGPTAQQNIGAPGAAPTGWLGGGTLGNFALFYQSNLWITAHSGLMSIGFGGNGTAGATIEQTFDTTPGLPYTVSFYTAAQQLGKGPQSYRAEALSGATVLGFSAGALPVSTTWTLRSFDFVATDNSTRLLISDTSNGPAAISLNWALDSVSVTAVPEPASFVLMGLGLLAVGASVRRRRA